MPRMAPDSMLQQDFGLIADLVHGYAQERPHHPALIHDACVLTYGDLDRLMDRVAASLQRVPIAMRDWLASEDAQPRPVQIDPGAPFNIIYSSGTTGTPKGIVQPFIMRWAHVRRGSDSGYGPDAVTLVST